MQYTYATVATLITEAPVWILAHRLLPLLQPDHLAGCRRKPVPSTSIEPRYRGERTEPRIPRGSDHDLAGHHPTERRAHTRSNVGITWLINLGDQL